MPSHSTPLERFLAKVDQESPADCWTWLGYKDRAGYGRFKIAGRRVYIHRFAYESYIGPISKGLTIDHLCRSRDCVNPTHMDALTAAEHTRRGRHVGRRKVGVLRGPPLAGDTRYLYPGSERATRARGS